MSRMGHGAAWTYRCFNFAPSRTGWKARNILSLLSHGIPRAFYWPDRNDIEGLKDYVDKVTAGRNAEAAEAEERGQVTHKEMDPEELTGSTSVNFKAFMNVLAHRGSIDIPLRQKVTFITDGSGFVPAEFITMLAEYADNPKWFGDPANWRMATQADLDRDMPRPSSGMYRSKTNFMDSGDAEPVPEFEPPSEHGYARQSEGPPSETEVHRISHDRYFELVTVVASRYQPYYVRRLARYNGALLWSGSSYRAGGPWTEYARDNAQLLALGVRP
jgi:hypothetical protein